MISSSYAHDPKHNAMILKLTVHIICHIWVRLHERGDRPMNGSTVRHGSAVIKADRREKYAWVRLHKRGERKMTSTTVRYGSTNVKNRNDHKID